MSARKVSFNEFEFDLQTLELRRDGGVVRLQPKPTRALELLLEHAGSLVSRQLIIEHVWPETIIEFDQGLNTCIRQLREALGDEASNPAFIETIPRRGYRFIGPVRHLSGRRVAVRSRPVRLAAAAALVIATVTIVPGLARSIAVDPPVRLVVMPIRSIGGDARDQEFADGLTEEVTTALAAVSPASFRVIGRTSAGHMAAAACPA